MLNKDPPPRLRYFWREQAIPLGDAEVALVGYQRGVGEQEAERTLPNAPPALLGASLGVVLVAGAAAVPSAREIFRPELRLKQEARDGLEEHPACCRDEMYIHTLRDDDLPTENELVVQRTQRHRPPRDPEPAVNAGQPLRVELLLDAGRNLKTSSSQVTGLCARWRAQAANARHSGIPVSPPS
ncbi:hypothetical protein EDB81DRAFT_862574 [Dactylonectria macrodidyma]|uniref:Uncharacterized protein n=1 Tax=Dactylonectria macrodidyma TaxID=307937 RepID=A0A9P9D6C5_9HYPO|nr:hypothetical protein EDB81DRAFT_862574 [Dactylonectria macrodidyma]